jgi:MFS family permease
VAAAVGFSYFAFLTSLSTVLQERLDDHQRGRVMALWIMGFGGTVPIGNLLAGPLIDHTSITLVMLGGAVCALVLTLYARLDVPARRRSPANANTSTSSAPAPAVATAACPGR